MASTILLKNALSGSIADSFINNLNNKLDRFYYFFGKTSSWDYDYNPDVANDTVYDEYQTRKDIVYLKSIQPSEVSLVAKRIDWKTGVVFDRYDDSYSTSVIGINLTSGGSGYLTPPTVTITGTGSGAAATAFISTTTQSVIGVTLTSRGSGYTNSVSNPPVVTFSDGSFVTKTTSTTVTTNDFGGVVLTLSSTSNIVLGQVVSGTNIATGTTVVNINGLTITLSQMILDDVASGTTLTFKNNASGTVTLCTAQGNVTSLEDASFYVLTDDYNVYVCLSNNSGVPSTIRPTGTSASPITLSDGYIWKYIFTIPAAQRLRFLNSKYFPVSTALKTQFNNSGQLKNVIVDYPGAGYSSSYPLPVLTISGDGFCSYESNTINGVTYRPYEAYKLTPGSLSVIAGGTGYGTTTPAVTVSPPVNSTAWSAGQIYIAGQYISNGNNHFVVITPGVSVTFTAPSTVSYDPFIPASDTTTYLYVGTTATGTSVSTAGAMVSAVLTASSVGEITVTAGGTGYANGALVSFTGGTGTGATGRLVVFSGSILGIIVTCGGTGYTTAPTSWTGNAGGATFTATLKSGSGYTTAPTISFAGGTGAVVTIPYAITAARIYPVIFSTQISFVIIGDPGFGYTTGSVSVPASAPTATISTDFSVGTVSTNQATTELSSIPGAIYNIQVVSGGFGYSLSSPIVISGDGTGATASVKSVSTAGAITAINVLTPGSGYTIPIISVVDAAGVGATLRAILPPIGGHGKDAVRQLFANDISVYSYLSKDYVSGVSLGATYRQFGIIRNPLSTTGLNITDRTSNASWVLTTSATVSGFSLGDGVSIVPNSYILTTINSSATPTLLSLSSTVGMSVGMSILANNSISTVFNNVPIITSISGNNVTISRPIIGSSGAFVSSGSAYVSNNIALMRVMYVYASPSTKIMLQSINGVTPITGSFGIKPGGASFNVSASPTVPTFDNETGNLIYLNNQIPFTPSISGNEIISVSTVIKL